MGRMLGAQTRFIGVEFKSESFHNLAPVAQECANCVATKKMEPFVRVYFKSISVRACSRQAPAVTHTDLLLSHAH